MPDDRWMHEDDLHYERFRRDHEQRLHDDYQQWLRRHTHSGTGRWSDQGAPVRHDRADRSPDEVRESTAHAADADRHRDPNAAAPAQYDSAPVVDDPLEPPDEGAVESVGRAIGEVVTGAPRRRGDSRLPPGGGEGPTQ